MSGTDLFRIMALLGLTLGFCGNADAGVVLKPGVYVIQMSNSNMTVAGSSDAEHSPLVLWPTRPSANWNFETTGNGYYSIDSMQNVLNGGDGKKGAPVTMTRMGGDWTNQMWKLVKVGRYYKFINLKTGQAMTLTSGQRTPGSGIGNAPVADTMDQLFCIQDMNNVGYCGEGGPYVDYSDGSQPDQKGDADSLRLLEEGKAQRIPPQEGTQEGTQEAPKQTPQQKPSGSDKSFAN